jgi:hypothetical protein
MEIETTLYQGKVKVKFLGPTEDKPNRHMYYVDGKRKTGVTTALNIKDKSNALLSWQREEVVKSLLPKLESGRKLTEKDILEALYASEDTKIKAADLGSKIHDWIERYINHRLKIKGFEDMPEMPDDPQVQVGVTSFLEWEAGHKVKFLWTEKIVYSKKHDYIGKADFSAKVDGIVCLCDIKTGNGMYNSVRAQTAAYATAFQEESNSKFDGRWAIRLAKETEGEYQERMALKNKIRALLGKEPNGIEPYQVFEAKFLDEDKNSMKEDFEAFLNHWYLYKWDAKTDFWKEKNG